MKRMRLLKKFGLLCCATLMPLSLAACGNSKKVHHPESHLVDKGPSNSKTLGKIPARDKTSKNIDQQGSQDSSSKKSGKKMKGAPITNNNSNQNSKNKVANSQIILDPNDIKSPYNIKIPSGTSRQQRKDIQVGYLTADYINKIPPKTHAVYDENHNIVVARCHDTKIFNEMNTKLGHKFTAAWINRIIRISKGATKKMGNPSPKFQVLIFTPKNKLFLYTANGKFEYLRTKNESF